jgi:hypothetical protein
MAVPLPSADSSERTTCDYCEIHVTSDFRRTYGSDDGHAKRCPECDSWARTMRGSARGVDVDHPDPQVADQRTGGKELRQKVATDGGASR